MSRGFLTFAIAGHVVAITVAAIPRPDTIPPLEPSPLTHSGIVRPTAKLADSAAQYAVAWSYQLWGATSDLRRVAIPYVNLTAQHQRWHMFSGSLVDDELVRVRYYIADRPAGQVAGTYRTVTERILPARPERSWAPIASFRASFRDKAILTAMEDFRSHLASGPGTSPDDLAPLAAHFAAAFARGLKSGERIARTEIWSGKTPIPPPGINQPEGDDPVFSRVGSSVEERRDLPSSRSRFVREREGSVTWTLLYVHE